MSVAKLYNLFVSLVYCAESTVRWFVVREKHCWMAADSADKSKRRGRYLAAATEVERRSTSRPHYSMQAVIASLVGQASRSVLSCRRGRSPVAAA
jgi:hypothetical protein